MYTKVVNGFIFDVGSDIATLIGCEITDAVELTKTQIVPSLVDHKPVTRISNSAFSFTGLRKIELPASITTVGHKAFFKSDVEEVVFYSPKDYPWQPKLQVMTSAFKDCVYLRLFDTQQTVIAEYLSFSNCPNLQYFGKRKNMQFECVHPEAFAYSGVEVIHVSNNGWLQVNSLNHSKVSQVHVRDAIQLPAKTLDYIKKHGIVLHVYTMSPLLDLIYEGVSVVETSLSY